jgi:hypothetical protein
MGRIAFVTLLFVLTVGCSEPPAPAPAREPLGIQYVAVPQLKIHEQPSDQSAVLATFRDGESVTVYAMKGDWLEVQLFDDRSGWARSSDLKETREDVGDSTFRRPPSPVWSPRKVQGQIVLEASVTEGGDVVSVRTLSNTTGDAALEEQNRAALLAAKFRPLVRYGKAHPFVYEYRVTY